jgi:PilZ domain
MEHAIDRDAKDQPLEARDQARRRTLKSGRIELKHQVSTIDVTIRDMSLSGALLLLRDIWTPPAEFGLLVLNPNNGKTQRHSCLKVWQKGTMVGVRFLV